MRRSLYDSRWTGALALALLTWALTVPPGCARVQRAESGAHLGDAARACALEERGPEECTQALYEAAAAGRRRDAGQLLLALAAREDDDEARAVLASAGLWLEDRPWLPEQGPWRLEALEDVAPGAAEESVGPIVAFAPLRARDIEGRAERAPIDPRSAQASAHLTPGALVAVLTAAVGADVGAWGQADAVRLTPAAPRMSSLSGIAPQLGPGQLELARLLRGADVAWQDGRHVDAGRALRTTLDALDELDEGERSCQLHAPLYHAASVLWRLGQGPVGEHASAARQACPPTPDDGPTGALFGALLALEDEEMPDQATRAALTEHGDLLTARQRAILQVQTRRVERGASAQEGCGDAGAPDDALERQLASLGRADLTYIDAARARVYELRGEEIARVDEVALRQWLAEQREPARQWLGPEAPGAPLARPLKRDMRGMRRISALDQAALAPTCQIYLDRLVGQLRTDTDAGAPQRAASRLVEEIHWVDPCIAHAPLEEMSTAAIEGMMNAKQGRSAVMEMLGSLTLQSLGLALRGDFASVTRLAEQLLPALQKLRAELGEAPEDQVLAALLDGLAGDMATFIDPARFHTQLLASLERIDEVIAQAPPEPPRLVAMAPSIRMTLGVAGAIHAVVLGRPDLATVMLNRLEAHAEVNVAGALALAEAPPELAAPMRAHLIAHLGLARAALGGAPSDLAERLSAVETEGLPAGWWRLGGRASQVTMLSISALILDQNGQSDLRDEALELSHKLVGVLVEGALADFEIEGTGWEMLRLLEPAYQVLLEFMLEEDAEIGELLRARAPQLRERARALLERTSARAQLEGSEAPPPDLVTLTLRTLELGLELELFTTLLEEDAPAPTEALLEASNRLGQEVESYPPETRVFALTTQGLAQALGSRGTQTEALTRALTTARRDAPELAPLPLGALLILEREYASKPAEGLAILAPLFDLEAEPAPAKSCARNQRQLMARALTPHRAELLARAGQPKEAAAARRSWLEGALEGAPDEAMLRCEANTERGKVSVNLILEHSASKLVAHDESDDGQGSLQIGLGYQSNSAFSQKISCIVTPIPRVDHARRLELATRHAVHALLHEDIEAASRALQQLAAFTYIASINADEPAKIDAGAIELAAALGHARGLTWTAQDINNQLLRLIKRGAEATDLRDELLAREELAPLAPALQLAMKRETAMDVASVREAWPEEQAGKLSIDLILVSLQHDLISKDGITLPDPAQLEDIKALAWEAARVRLNPSEVFGLLAQIEQAGYHAEAASLWAVFVGFKSLPEAKLAEVLELWRRLDPAAAPRARQWLTDGLIDRYSDALSAEVREELLQARLQQNPDAPSAQQNLALWMALARAQWAADQREAARATLHTISAELMDKGPSLNGQLSLAILEATAALLTDDPPAPATLAGLEAIRQRAPDQVEPVLADWIQAMYERRDEPAALRERAQTTLATMLQLPQDP